MLSGSTLLSQPNKVGLKCWSIRPCVHMYVRPSIRTFVYVCPQKVCLISVTFGMYIEVDE